MESKDFDLLIQSLDDQLAQADGRRAALLNARPAAEQRAILRVKLASLLALGAWPREDLAGTLLALKGEEIGLLQAAQTTPHPPADGSGVAILGDARKDLTALLDELQKADLQLQTPAIATAMLRLWACRWRWIVGRLRGCNKVPHRDLSAAYAFIIGMRKAYPEKRLPFLTELNHGVEHPWDAEVEKAKRHLAELQARQRELDELGAFLSRNPIPDSGEGREDFITKARKIASSPPFRDELRTLLGEHSLLLQADIPELWTESSLLPKMPPPVPPPRSRRAILAMVLHDLRSGRLRGIEGLLNRFTQEERQSALEAIHLLVQGRVLRRDDTRLPKVGLAPGWAESAKEFAFLGRPLGVACIDHWILADAQTQAA